MRLIITGGGTGGHLFPGIAMAQAMRERIADTEVLFIGTERAMDQQVLAQQDFARAVLRCGGVKGIGWSGRIRTLLRMPGAVRDALRLLKEFRPDMVFAVGGYVTGPVLLAARLLRVPIAIHEQNSVPGLANRLAGYLADRVFISLPCKPAFPARKTVQTGNPVRQTILAAAETRIPREGEPFTLLVLGGSQGAHRVNLIMLEAVPHLLRVCPEIRIIHQTGTDDADLVRGRYQELGVDAEVVAFIDDMAGAYGRADLAVSRAGATTLAELAVMGVPALLVPYPYAADNHQFTNARHYAWGQGCRILLETDLTGEIVAQTISEYLQNRKELHTMAANMRRMAMPDAAGRIVEECLRLTTRRQ
ncbi:MAG: undecaprenyldiphospho-muramoylpentapeptide beta-N-acetylglucosaminyltransferase [Desulfobulbus sp.]|jgi:UDP-N-acetylglucosamine--N-acetylmuramyl-(pentapeptide) pyrophosphoryl-undecaprenol N-acetylglucosamine transferase